MSKTIKQLEAENKQLKEKLSSLTSNIKALTSFERNAEEIFWQMDFSLQTTYISKKITDFLGYTPEEFMAKEYKQLVTPETYQKFLKLQQQFVKEEKLIDEYSVPKYFLLDIEHIDKQGKIKPAKVKFSLFYDEDNNPVGIQGYTLYKDIAQLLSREPEQLKSLFNSIFAQSVEGVFLFLLPYSSPWTDKIDKDKQLKRILSQLKPVGFNQVILDQFKMTKEEFSQFRIANLSKWRTVSKFWKDLFDQGKIQVKQLMRNKKGEPLAIEGEFVTLYNNQKDILGVFGIQHDITDSFLIEETTEHEFKLKELWDKANFAIFVVQDEKVVFWNKTAFEIINPNIEKNKTYKFSEIVYEEDLPLVYERYSKQIQGEDVESTYNFRIKTSKGEIKWLQLHSVFYLWNGKPATLNFARDITLQKTLEEKIRQNEAQYRLLAENSTDGVALFENGELVYISPSYAKILGDYLEITRIEELFDYIHPDDLSKIKQQIKKIKTEKIERYTYQYRIRKSDGSYVWFEDIIHSEFDENGNQVRVIFNSRDVTKRIEAQQELKEKEKQLEMLLTNMSDFLLLFDKDGIIKYTTPHTLSYFGFSEKEVIGKSVFEFIYPPDLEKIIFDFSESVKNKMVKQKLYRVIKKDGSFFWVEFDGNAIENEQLEFVIVGRDVTERIEIQEQLKKQHTELSELNATKDKFFSILAHDLRSPFNQIMGFSDLLSQNIHKYDAKKIVHFVEIIRNSSVKAYQLLENLLNWSMAKRGMMEFYPVILNIIPLITEEINRLSEQIKTKKIDLTLQTSVNIFISADENMFRIIIRNILNNAIKFTPVNGKINISFTQKDNEVVITIKDNGTGMEESQIHSLFKLSENRSSEGTQGERGTGLGLLVVKEFVDKHNAEIKVNSKKDKGTEVKLIFQKKI